MRKKTTKTTHFFVGNAEITVVQKHIKSINIRVYPPCGDVIVTAPLSIGISQIKTYITSKHDWIVEKQNNIRKSKPLEQKSFTSGEKHLVFGERYMLQVHVGNCKPAIHLKEDKILMYIPFGYNEEMRSKLLDEWYRYLLKREIEPMIRAREKQMGVRVSEFRVKKMKTRWGTCNTKALRIWINLELAKKPLECLEYIVVHEMTHLIERYHNTHFYSLLDKYMPNWRESRKRLKS